ncbi:MAG: YfiR family protein [Bacteroidales bacterium]|nr:YfiR family protein [Bacteroidales bacterium]
MKIALSKLIVQVLVVFGVLGTSSQYSDEYSLKAAWLGKFTHFIEWPVSEQNKVQFFSIGVYKTNPFGNILENLYDDYQIWGKPVKIKYINSIDSVKTVNMLFVPKSAMKNFGKLVTETRKIPVLLICEAKGSAETGAHINFYFINDKIRFEINESAMRDSGFFVSFRLLNIAQIIKPESDQ